MSENIVTLDVRADIRSGREPFSKIMNTVAQLRPDENLLLFVPFEPVPLFGVLAKQGFNHAPRQIENGDWEVLFMRNGKTQCGGNEIKPAANFNVGCGEGKSTQIIEVDARGLEPPQPMVKILEALSSLPAGTELRARTDRRPMHLYAQLESRGFIGQTKEHNDGSFITIIRAR